MSINRDIPELLKAGVITPDLAESIQSYYKTKNRTSNNRLFVVFGIFGAILVGLGIILIVAHNWDELSRTTKTLLSFFPLIFGQAICGFSIIYKHENVAWRESGATFLFFSVGASISLISQVYNIPGSLGSFLLTWMLLSLPLIYVMKSSFTSLLYLVGITYYAAEIGYWTYPSSESYLYWFLLLLALPHYFHLYNLRPKSNFMVFHNWLIPLSVAIILGTVAHRTTELMFIAYFSLFGLFYSIGESDIFTQQKTRNNGFKVIGSIGTITLLLSMSFRWFWESLSNKVFHFEESIMAPEFLASTLITLMAVGLLFMNVKKRTQTKIRPLALVFILYIAIFMIGIYFPVADLLINITISILGMMIMMEGSKEDHIGKLNFGLFIIAALIICRFFDTDLSFIFRGLLFMLVGAGFFTANYLMLKKRKTNE